MATTPKKNTTAAKKSCNAGAKKSTARNAQITKGTQNQSTYDGTKKRSNAQTEFAQDMCKLTDKEIISDVLSSQKSLIKLYGTALCECSCKNLRELIGYKLSECAEDQFDMFLYMNERGMYPTDPAPAAKVNQAKQMYCQECDKMKK